MIKLLSALCAATLVLASGCTEDTPAPPATSLEPPAPATSSKPKADPYEVYLKNAPKGAPELSREDAQTRALLGCGRDWAPGTVDAVLAEAYKELCAKQGNDS